MDLVKTQDGTIEQLFAGEFPRLKKGVTIASESGDLQKGTVLGRYAADEIDSEAYDDNAADTGTLTLDITTPIKSGAQIGVYNVVLVDGGEDSDYWELTDPYGKVVDTKTAGATVNFDNQVKFAIAAGTEPFSPDEGFTITINHFAGDYAPYDDNDSTYGLGKAIAILADDIDATDAATLFKANVYLAGHFNEDALTGYDAGALVDFLGTPIIVSKIL